MKERSDSELLQAYSVDRDEAAFEAPVGRYAGLVWGTARRIAGDDDAARDVCQQVFALFARKLPGFTSGVVVPAWLHRTATFEARKHLRSLSRRTRREHLANAIMNPPEAAAIVAENDELLPVLDDSLEQLGGADREVLVLRFFMKSTLREIGDSLGISEAASQKRVERALERLRAIFVEKGVSTASAGGVAGVLTFSALTVAPEGFVAVASGSALATHGAATGLGAWWAAMQGLSAGAKAQILAGSLVVAGVGVPAVVQNQRIDELTTANATMNAELKALPDLEAQLAERERMLALQAEMERRLQDHAELLALREELANVDPNVLREGRELEQALNDAEAEAREVKASIAAKRSELDAEFRAEAVRAKTINEMKKLGIAALGFARDHDDALPATFEDMRKEMVDVDPKLPGDLLLRNIEFFDHGKPFAHVRNSPLILFREIAPRRLPDGTWERAYTLTDTSVQNFVAEDGDFSEFESRVCCGMMGGRVTTAFQILRSQID